MKTALINSTSELPKITVWRSRLNHRPVHPALFRWQVCLLGAVLDEGSAPTESEAKGQAQDALTAALSWRAKK